MVDVGLAAYWRQHHKLRAPCLASISDQSRPDLSRISVAAATAAVSTRKTCLPRPSGWALSGTSSFAKPASGPTRTIPPSTTLGGGGPPSVATQSGPGLMMLSQGVNGSKAISQAPLLCSNAPCAHDWAFSRRGGRPSPYLVCTHTNRSTPNSASFSIRNRARSVLLGRATANSTGGEGRATSCSSPRMISDPCTVPDPTVPDPSVYETGTPDCKRSTLSK